MSQIELQPTLTGSTIRLRPLKSEDFEDLYRAASDPEIWELHPDSTRYMRDVFKERFFDGALASRGALAIVDVANGHIIGASRFYEWNPVSEEISIGYTFIERAFWGAGTNSKLKELMLSHIYQWATVVWFHVGKDNIRSRRAVEKLGASLCYEKERELHNRVLQAIYRGVPNE
jgi:N-acetyltransferase